MCICPSFGHAEENLGVSCFKSDGSLHAYLMLRFHISGVAPGGGGRPLGSGRQLPPPPINCWPEAPGGGGGGVYEGLGGGALWEGWFGGGPSGVLGGGGGAPLTSSCPPSNHTITINLTLTFAAN